ncbi:MAG: hypothetical protein M3Z96_00675 [Pseudomonadota bacterium]|nr:hypothetical protein [Pseudomonadota bacterium]
MTGAEGTFPGRMVSFLEVDGSLPMVFRQRSFFPEVDALGIDFIQLDEFTWPYFYEDGGVARAL